MRKVNDIFLYLFFFHFGKYWWFLRVNFELLPRVMKDFHFFHRDNSKVDYLKLTLFLNA